MWKRVGELIGLSRGGASRRVKLARATLERRLQSPAQSRVTARIASVGLLGFVVVCEVISFGQRSSINVFPSSLLCAHPTPRTRIPDMSHDGTAQSQLCDAFGPSVAEHEDCMTECT